MQPAWIKRRWRIFKKAGDAPCVRLLARLVTENLKTQCGVRIPHAANHMRNPRVRFLQISMSAARKPALRGLFPFRKRGAAASAEYFFNFLPRVSPRASFAKLQAAQIPRHSRVTASAAYLNYAAFCAANPTPVARLPANDHRRAVELSIPQKVFLRRGAWRFSCKPPNACLTSGFRRFAPKRRA